MIPFLDLKRQYAGISDELEEAVIGALRSGSYVLGAPVERFEEDFAAWCGTSEAVAVNTGTSALQLALLACDIGPGDEVITVPATFVATVAAVLYTGATPVLVDVNPETLCMDPAKIEAAITPRTKAILPVHFHGRLADMAAICGIARAKGLRVIEDAAQAHGAERDGVRAGAFGDLACFSFYPGKNLGAAGEGGAVTSNDSKLAERVRRLRDWGQSERYVHTERGYNFRMDALQGAVLGVKLKHLDPWTAGRRQVAAAYDAGLSDAFGKPLAPTGSDYVGHVYAVTCENRDGLRTVLSAAGIGSNIHYPRPVHLQPAYGDLGYGPGDFPVAEDYARRTASLPIFPELSEHEIAQVIHVANQFAETLPAEAASKKELAL